MQLPWIDEEALAKAHPRLFHYTNKASLPLILRSGGLFATEYSRTNDKSEFKALRDPLVQRMADYARQMAKEKNAKQHLNAPMTDAEFDAMIEGDAFTFFEIMVRVMPTTPHITCFSMHKEPHHISNGLLTMWRMYGGGAGVALGFDTAKIVRATERIQKTEAIDTIYLDRVGYGVNDPEVQRRLEQIPTIDSMFSRYLIALMEGRTELDEAESSDLFGFLTLCACAKHPDFEDEREVRLIAAGALDHTRNDRPIVESSNGRILLKYLDALEEVLVGPSENQDANVLEVNAYLSDAGFAHVAVRKSDTPFIAR